MVEKQRIDFLVEQLNQASQAYYGGQSEQMTDFEWDALFDELTALERETGYLRPDSPTRTTSHAESAGEKEPHEFPALSLAKTKQLSELQKWADGQEVWMSWKLDGLTLVLTYDGGSLRKILTRGNGEVGNNITFMQDAIRGIPQTVSEQGHLVVRGEAVISYPDFEALNDTLEEEKFANPRNLASGTLALDKSNLDKVRERKISFHAFTLVYTDRALRSWGERMALLDTLGFVTVQRERTDAQGLPAVLTAWSRRVESGELELPVDGLVITYDDTEFAATGSVTGHHATRAGLAYKWQDVTAVSVLDHIEWSCAASTITPVAVFAPVQLEGTTVSRASLCNLSELERLGIGADGQTTLQIIKANKIIPKCTAVLAATGCVRIPDKCPVCCAPTQIRISESTTKTLRCTNPDCPAKHLKRFARFVSKTGMDIDGLSIQTLHAFINAGFIHEYADIFQLSAHASEIITMEGMGEKSCENLLSAIERSRQVNPVNFLFALCIPMIGVDAGKKIVAALGTDGLLQRIGAGEGFEDVDGIGPERSSALVEWFSQQDNRSGFDRLLQELRLQQLAPKLNPRGRCEGLTFVITGEVAVFANRSALRDYVESEGGAVTGSVSGKTDFLINNDLTSPSAKNRKAQELGIPILSEADFIARFGKPSDSP